MTAGALNLDDDTTEKVTTKSRAVKVVADASRPRWKFVEAVPAGDSLRGDFARVAALLDDGEPCVLLVHLQDAKGKLSARENDWMVVLWVPEDLSDGVKSKYWQGVANFASEQLPTLRLGELRAGARAMFTWRAFLDKAEEIVGELHFFQDGKLTEPFALDAAMAAPAKVSWSAKLGDTLRGADGSPLPTDDALAGKSKVALFFAGSWCSWCRAFTPFLEGTMKKVADAYPNDTQVVYIPADVDQAAFDAYVSGKTWLSMPYDVSQGNDQVAVSGQVPMGFVPRRAREETGKPQGILGEKYKIAGLPTMVVLDGATGEILYNGEDFIKELGASPDDGHALTTAAPPSWLEVLA